MDDLDILIILVLIQFLVLSYWTTKVVKDVNKNFEYYSLFITKLALRTGLRVEDIAKEMNEDPRTPIIHKKDEIPPILR